MSINEGFVWEQNSPSYPDPVFWCLWLIGTNKTVMDIRIHFQHKIHIGSKNSWSTGVKNNTLTSKVICWNQTWKVESVVLKMGDHERLKSWTSKLMNIETLMYMFLISDLMEEGGTMTVFHQNNMQHVWCVPFLLLHNRHPYVMVVSVDFATVGVWMSCPHAELYFFSHSTYHFAHFM
jgi:hypothetical protein